MSNCAVPYMFSFILICYSYFATYMCLLSYHRFNMTSDTSNSEMSQKNTANMSNLSKRNKQEKFQVRTKDIAVSIEIQLCTLWHMAHRAWHKISWHRISPRIKNIPNIYQSREWRQRYGQRVGNLFAYLLYCL